MLAVLAFLILSSAEAADTTVIRGGPRCPTCSIELVLHRRLGDESENGMLAGSMGETLARDSSGAYWLWSYSLGSALWLFDVDGEPLQMGRKGNGPREYADISGVGLTADGRVVVYDSRNQRFDFYGPGGHFLRSIAARIPFRGMRDLVAAGPGRFLLSSVIMEGASTARPLHVMELREGTPFVSFGVTPEVLDHRLTSLYQQRKVSIFGARVAAAHQYQYQIDIYDLNSKHLLGSVVRDVPWFRPVDVRTVRPPETPPSPMLMGLRLVNAAEALVLIRRPRADWRNAYVRTDFVRNPEVGYEVSAQADVFETVVEHLQLDRGEVLARIRVEGVAIGFVQGTQQIAVLDDRDTVPSIGVYDVVLR